MSTEKTIIVFYHADCIDGFSAAWVAHKKFGNKADYIPTYFEQESIDIKNKEVYMLDVVFENREVMKQLLSENKRVTVIDHHISAKDITLSTHKPLFSLDHCGCVLAWQYFFPGKPIPKFLLNVEDIDIWKHKIKGSQFLYLYLDLFDYTFQNWSKLVKEFEIPTKRKRMLEMGEVIDTHTNKKIDHVIEDNAKKVTLDGYTVYAVNTTHSNSVVGHKVATAHPPFAIIWREKKDGSVTVSLRGVGNIDVSKIALKYGGGGHKLAAAFRLPSLKDIPWIPVN